jgi:HAD superfamily hydrolase (TIGR01490 family)
MPLALFDLDNTLIAGDSDYLWGRFLVERGLVDGERYERANEQFYADYRAGCLDIHAFLRFALAPLAAHPLEQLLRLREAFVRERIEPILLPAARDLVQRHRSAGDTLVVITATNAFVTAPIAAAYGVPHLIATEPEQREGRYTGAVAGVPAFQDGKVERLAAWLEEHGGSLEGSSFYSDSHNDLPLLLAVERAVAVDPDPLLLAEAERRGWPVISLR